MTLALALLLGAVIGLSLGALGGGGSILTVPALVYALGEKASAATTGSLIIVGITALVGSFGHARAGRVRWRAGFGFGLAGVASSSLGTALNRHINPDVLLLAFAGLVVIAASGMWRHAGAAIAVSGDQLELRVAEPALAVDGSNASRSAAVELPGDRGIRPTPASQPEGSIDFPGGSTTHDSLRTVLKVVAAGLIVGFLTGFFGVGGGFVIVPALALVLAYPMPEAIGTSLLIIAINSAAALGERAGQHQTVHWHVIAPFTVAAVAASLAGKQVADRVDGPRLTRAFVILLIAVAIYTAVRSIVGLS